MHYIHIKSFLKVAVLDLKKKKKKPFHKNSKYVTVKKNKNKMSK